MHFCLRSENLDILFDMRRKVLYCPWAKNCMLILKREAFFSVPIIALIIILWNIHICMKISMNKIILTDSIFLWTCRAERMKQTLAEETRDLSRSSSLKHFYKGGFKFRWLSHRAECWSVPFVKEYVLQTWDGPFLFYAHRLTEKVCLWSRFIQQKKK